MWNDFCMKHPIAGIFLSYMFFILMVLMVYFTGGMGLVWFAIIETVLILACITHCIYLLDPSTLQEAKSNFKKMAESDRIAKEIEKQEKLQKRKEWKEASTAIKIRKIWLKILGSIATATVVAGIIWYIKSNEITVSCDTNSMKIAENLLNEHFTNFNGNLRLSDPEEVYKKNNFVRCRANTNIHQDVYYNVEKVDGRIQIYTNPIGDILEEAAHDLFY